MTQAPRTRPVWVSRLLGMPGAVSFRRFEAYARAAGHLAAEITALSDEELASAASTVDIQTGGPLPRDAGIRFLAIAREAAARTVGLRPFDEQLIACCALMSGNAVEMDTGEGKTLAGAMAAAGHALSGRPVHVISVNDYLAERDAAWMAPFFELLGVTVASIGQHSSHEARQAAYRRNVVYVSVSEVGFDLLRDRFAVAPNDAVNPRCDAAIVDEADAVMIDEAMVPLVLAGASDIHSQDFAEATRLVRQLTEGQHYGVDADHATVTLTDEGLDHLEAELGGVNLYALDHVATLTRLNLALHARVLVRRDVDYLVDGTEIKLINAGRGRIAHLQRWPDGLHAAVEAKEGLAASAPGVILDTITIQDLLLGYLTLSGMSGTVVSVAEDLLEFYTLPAGRVERHTPLQRHDEPDRVFVTGSDRLSSVIAEVATRHSSGQPVLVGTRTVAESESLALLLDAEGIESRVLNARNNADEAAVIASAGEYAAVTISTQMSGRGTDIRLGGTDERDRERVLAAGGLAVIATGRYPSARLDAQLRGRSGRQGDPGTSMTFTSLDDELILSTVPPHVLDEIAHYGEAMSASRRQTIVNASQRMADGIRLDRHRATWGYNRAIAAQRAAVLAHRRDVLTGDLATAMLRPILGEGVESPVVGDSPDMTHAARVITLFYLDQHWMQHLALLQEVRDGIHLRALAGYTPLDEFHSIALREFQGFFDAVYRDVAAFISGLDASELGRGLHNLDSRRPSSTWTYMITDDPFGSAGDRLARELGKRWRTGIPRRR